jgi:hypothetical protein
MPNSYKDAWAEAYYAALDHGLSDFEAEHMAACAARHHAENILERARRDAERSAGEK